MALQFPIVMSSPIAALSFAVLITVSLGSVSAKVGATLAPLPIFALILVSNMLTLYCSNLCKNLITRLMSNVQMHSISFLIAHDTGSAHNAAYIVAGVSGFGCISVDYTFQLSNFIEQR